MILFTIFVVLACPEWKCEELETDLCAIWDEKSVKVNSKPCSDNKHCYLLGLELERNWKVQGKYFCEEFELEMMTESINCQVFKTGERYEERHPVKCFTDSHCRLASGKTKNCVCAFDGKSYCELAEDDLEIYYYLANCPYLNKSEAFVWYLFIDLFPMLNKVSQCFVRRFEDLALVKRYSKMLNIGNDVFLDEE
jgi:hypothetical protein